MEPSGDNEDNQDNPAEFDRLSRLSTLERADFVDNPNDTIAEELFFESCTRREGQRRSHRIQRLLSHRGQRRRYSQFSAKGSWHQVTKFCSKIPHVIWSFFVETFYIPAYRFEWGKFRKWSYDKHGRKEFLNDPVRAQEHELRRERQNFIKIRRRETEISGMSMRERHLGCRRVRINCGGIMFETQARTLQQLPHTLLGNLRKPMRKIVSHDIRSQGDPAKRKRFWNPKTNEYYFDRSPDSFECIIHFYQSGGSRLERPQRLGIEDYRKELAFFGIKGRRVDEFAEEEGELEEKYGEMPGNLLQRKIWLLLEYPRSSYQAELFSYLSITSIVLSSITYCLDTMDEFRGKYSRMVEIVDVRDPLFCTEVICVIFFTLELLARLASAPNKKAFVKSFPNVVDCIAIVPILMPILVADAAEKRGGEFGLKYVDFELGSTLERCFRFTKAIRVLRILKLSRHSIGLRILGQTLHASFHELALLTFFLMVGVVLFSSSVYYIEGYFNPSTNFTSIPATFYWAVSTMTTTGFDKSEELPKTIAGKIIGSICAITGVLTLALPVPVVVANFTYFYHRGMRYKRDATEKKKHVHKMKHIGQCPFLSTCEADNIYLEHEEKLSVSSKAGVEKWFRRSNRNRKSVKGTEGLSIPSRAIIQKWLQRTAQTKRKSTKASIPIPK